MNPTLKNILAVLAGIFLGAMINSLIISLSGSFIAPPAGVDVNDLESIKANIHLYEVKHFIPPFLAHALGSLVGGFTVAYIAVQHKMKFATGIGFLFMIGGIAAVYMIPAPIWFEVLDLVVAYVPMAWLGGKLASKKN